MVLPNKLHKSVSEWCEGVQFLPIVRLTCQQTYRILPHGRAGLANPTNGVPCKVRTVELKGELLRHISRRSKDSRCLSQRPT